MCGLNPDRNTTQAAACSVAGPGKQGSLRRQAGETGIPLLLSESVNMGIDITVLAIQLLPGASLYTASVELSSSSGQSITASITKSIHDTGDLLALGNNK